MRKLLARIDRRMPAGPRDDALISVALQTGQRVRASASMTIRGFAWEPRPHPGDVSAHQGGKVKEKLLETETSAILCAYLQRAHQECWQEQGDAPVWISLSHHTSRVTRHTAAKIVDESGTTARISSIMSVWR